MATIVLQGPYLGRIHRVQANDEVIAVSLELIRDTQSVELMQDDEFMTFYSKIDPWEAGTEHG